MQEGYDITEEKIKSVLLPSNVGELNEVDLDNIAGAINAQMLNKLLRLFTRKSNNRVIGGNDAFGGGKRSGGGSR